MRWLRFAARQYWWFWLRLASPTGGVKASSSRSFDTNRLFRVAVQADYVLHQLESASAF